MSFNMGGGPPPVDLSHLSPELLGELRKLRAVAVNRRLDMTDTLSEFCGEGRDASVGVMLRSRFTSAMGTMFKGGLSIKLLEDMCKAYAAGDRDPERPDLPTKVRWKQFAIEFDEVPELDEVEVRDASPELYAELRELRAQAVNKRLDMTDAMSEMAGTGREANMGVMSKRNFKGAMGKLFFGVGLKEWVLNGISEMYGCGPADAREGGFQQVRWKRFALDFDEIPLPVVAEPPDPNDAILPIMREMNEFCNKFNIDLADDFEEYLGGGNKCTSDVMPRDKFCAGLGVMLGRATSLYHVQEKVMDAICHTYRAGKPIARDPRKFEFVQWREFSNDVKRVQVALAPHLASPPRSRLDSRPLSAHPCPRPSAQVQPYIDSHEAPRRSPRKGELEQ